MARKCKQLHVLTAGLVSVRNDTWIIHEYTKHMTGFTNVLLPLVSDYSRVLSTLQDSLVGIYHSSVITREYKSARQQLFTSIFNLSAIAHEHSIFHVARAQHASYLSNFLEAQSISYLRLL